jgi:hypothetical protein
VESLPPAATMEETDAALAELESEFAEVSRALDAAAPGGTAAYG